jgi:CRP/FNR family transcriptional regulator
MNSATTIRQASLASSLGRSLIFRGLSDEDLFRIASYSSVQPLAKGAILFKEGDPVDGFFVLRKGLIKAYRSDAEGREQFIHLIEADQSFAEPAVGGLSGYPADTRALEDSEVILIGREGFLEHLGQHSDLALRMLASLSRHLHELVGTIESYKLRDAESRLLHWLLERCRSDGGASEIRLHTTKVILAEELGSRPETLSRILAKLREAGLIALEGRCIRVPAPEELRRLLSAARTEVG